MLLYFIYSLYELKQSQVNGLAQECSNSSAKALELLLSCAKPSKYKLSI